MGTAHHQSYAHLSTKEHKFSDHRRLAQPPYPGICTDQCGAVRQSGAACWLDGWHNHSDVLAVVAALLASLRVPFLSDVSEFNALKLVKKVAKLILSLQGVSSNQSMNSSGGRWLLVPVSVMVTRSRLPVNGNGLPS